MKFERIEDKVQLIFISEHYGRRKEFVKGQKVEAIYYHEYDNMNDSFKRSLASILFDKPFHPVKLGIVINSAGVHPYWLGRERKEEYLWVRFKEYRFNKAIPISCLTDAKEAAKTLESFICHNLNNIGNPGYDLASFNFLLTQMSNALNYTKNK